LTAPVSLNPASGKRGRMMPHFRDRARYAVLLLVLSACAIDGGCSAAKPSSSDYLKSLQQTAMRGEFARTARVDISAECPACTPEDTIFAQNIVSAEQGFGAGCKGMPAAEASYRKIKTLMEPGNSSPEYETFVTTRRCQVAEQYQTCTAPGHRLVAIGDDLAPAGALVAAIDQCRESNSAEANEILNRAIAQESESINRAVLAGNFASAKPELRVYTALPRSSRQRAEQWRATIAAEESGQRDSAARTSAQVKSMVCDDHYYAHNQETDFATTVAGMNMRHGGKIESDDPVEHVSSTDAKETRLASLSWALSNVEELSASQAREMLNQAYARASKDRSYCGR
jgi:hypothetical protein